MKSHGTAGSNGELDGDPTPPHPIQLPFPSVVASTLSDHPVCKLEGCPPMPLFANCISSSVSALVATAGWALRAVTGAALRERLLCARGRCEGVCTPLSDPSVVSLVFLRVSFYMPTACAIVSHLDPSSHAISRQVSLTLASFLRRKKLPPGSGHALQIYLQEVLF